MCVCVLFDSTQESIDPSLALTLRLADRVIRWHNTRLTNHLSQKFINIGSPFFASGWHDSRSASCVACSSGWGSSGRENGYTFCCIEWSDRRRHPQQGQGQEGPSNTTGHKGRCPVVRVTTSELSRHVFFPFTGPNLFQLSTGMLGRYLLRLLVAKAALRSGCRG